MRNNIAQFLGLCLVVGILYGIYIKQKEIIANQQIIISRTEHIQRMQDKEAFVNDSVLLGYIKQLNIRFPKIVLAQAKLESSNYSSQVFINNCNLFGMTRAAQRPTLGMTAEKINKAKNGVSGRAKSQYAHYKTWRESVIDYALWQAQNAGKVKTEKEYYALLGKRYAEDKEYVKKIKSIVNR